MADQTKHQASYFINVISVRLGQTFEAPSPFRPSAPSSSMDVIWTTILKWGYITLTQILLTYYRVPPKGLWSSATFSSSLNHQFTIMLTTQDSLQLDNDLPEGFWSVHTLWQLQSGRNVELILRRVRDLPKSKLVAWVVSNCKTPSKREDYVSELQKHIPVDIFGGCGTKSCPGTRTNSECGSLLERDYMFYLAFENSKCNDYVTEKFYNALSIDIVPIVMGAQTTLPSARPAPTLMLTTSPHLKN